MMGVELLNILVLLLLVSIGHSFVNFLLDFFFFLLRIFEELIEGGFWLAALPLLTSLRILYKRNLTLWLRG